MPTSGLARAPKAEDKQAGPCERNRGLAFELKKVHYVAQTECVRKCRMPQPQHSFSQATFSARPDNLWRRNPLNGGDFPAAVK